MANIQNSFEPRDYEEAKGSLEYKKAMQAEHETFMRNQTWALMEIPPRKKPIHCKWVYKVKYKANGTLDKHRAGPVAKGFA